MFQQLRSPVCLVVIGAVAVNVAFSYRAVSAESSALTTWMQYGSQGLAGGGLIALLLMQWTQRRQAEARHEAILRALPDLVLLQSTDGVYLDYHAANLASLLSPPEQFLGKNMRDVLPPDILRQTEAAFSRVARTAGPAEPVVVNFEVALPHGGGRRFEARLVRTSNNHVLTVVREVTEQYRVETALRESARRYEVASVAGSVGVWDWNFETNELFVDPTLKNILGFEEAEITRNVHDWGSRLHPDDLPLAAGSIKACLDGDSDVYEVEHRMVHKDGSVRWFLSRGSAIRAEDGVVRRMVGTKVDITARKLAEAKVRENEAELQASNHEIRRLAGSLIAAQDAERSRMARDLHDDVGQELAGLSIAISNLNRRVAASQGPSLEADISSLQHRAIALADSIRNISHDLHPEVLKHGGLPDALRALAAGMSASQPTLVTSTVDGMCESIGPEIALSLYRIAQEVLHNVVKHASASRAEVRLRRIVDGVELTIVDDGQGFDVATARAAHSGLGLVSINERVRLAGGSLSIVTELQKGTRVQVRMPMVSTGLDASETAGRVART
jgi:two-component system sensor histidine kinase UhpB